MAEPTYVPTPYSYSSAVVAGEYVFLGLHRGFGEDFRAQLGDVFANLQQTLGSLEMPLSSIVQVRVWLKEIGDLPEMEKLFANYFEQGRFPARMTATTRFIDDDCLVMVEGIAWRG
jgi:2-iminobutanoate/2-iminopropanoate deaminase